MKIKKTLSIGLATIITLTTLVGCGTRKTDEKASTSNSNQKIQEVKIGATSGPYSDMVNKAIKPLLEKKGYKISIVEFTDYIRPNHALNDKEIDANLFQHKIYMDKFAKENNMDLTALVQVPTAPMGLYSDKIKDINKIQDKAEVTLPNDPSNAARAYILLSEAGLIKLKKDIDPLKASQKDIIENPKHLQFTELEAAQLARSLSSSTISAVPGNFALAANFDLTTALKLEKMTDNNRNNIVVKSENKDSKLSKDLISIVKSKEFDEIINTDFKGFDKPLY
ncbi:MetQ/NlpA family ABC transporter substrate-binding protein [Peptostreptococcus equinus]|uniref:Lipoprotein n=1 Tax=Peptostreptococcus equinus TaxID=3003601 RepID=A0ABY7JN48_9FIRM|nr:MetQ/NlpA family ABC transporter substrate-binding protein [Peptostreptococcus sp. CBA3647]WAW14800.1 MetQ/NlpA family ABC transporter substrate-binding protein [Peptostreptococcus sp. CBA3647]